MFIYTHGYIHFKNEEHARQYTKENINNSKIFYEANGHVCSAIAERVKYKGNKEVHIFSFTYPDSYNQRKVAVISSRYTIQRIS
jgi:hypothetical protein